MHFVQPKKNTNSLISDSYLCHSNQLILECKVHGTPNPSITWFKNDREIRENEKYSLIEHRDGIRQLVITHPTDLDNGTYTCCATNSVKTSEISHVVDITEDLEKNKRKQKHHYETEEDFKLDLETPKLIFETPLKNITVAQGQSAKFVCSVKGSVSDRNVIWLMDGRPIKFISSNKYLSTFNGGLIILEIFDLLSNDSGEYTCLINKGANEIRTTSKLYVDPVPSATNLNSRRYSKVSFTKPLKGLIYS